MKAYKSLNNYQYYVSRWVTNPSYWPGIVITGSSGPQLLLRYLPDFYCIYIIMILTHLCTLSLTSSMSQHSSFLINISDNLYVKCIWVIGCDRHHLSHPIWRTVLKRPAHDITCKTSIGWHQVKLTVLCWSWLSGHWGFRSVQASLPCSIFAA